LQATDLSTMPSATAPIVILLHGLGRTSRSMQPIARAADAHGYRVVNLGYRSRTAGIQLLAEGVAHEVDTLDRTARLHFVTHSLGGILLRVAVATGLLRPERVGRVVMLAPPNRGSEVADLMASRASLRALFRSVSGPAGSELGTGAGDIIARLPAVNFHLGVIAGSRSLNPVFSAVIDGANDGKVGVARAAVDGMHDFLVVPHSHTFLMRAPAVIRQTMHFLEHGRFEQEDGAA
jgi:triacylglycerol lipase